MNFARTILIFLMLMMLDASVPCAARRPRGRRVRSGMTYRRHRRNYRHPRTARAAYLPYAGLRGGGGSVWICMGPGSRRYHISPSCRGFNNCTTNAYKVTLSKAQSMGRTPCGWCY